MWKKISPFEREQLMTSHIDFFYVKINLHSGKRRQLLRNNIDRYRCIDGKQFLKLTFRFLLKRIKILAVDIIENAKINYLWCVASLQDHCVTYFFSIMLVWFSLYTIIQFFLYSEFFMCWSFDGSRDIKFDGKIIFHVSKRWNLVRLISA